MTEVVGAVDASTARVSGTVRRTSASFSSSTGTSGVTLPISSDDVDVEGTAYDLTTTLTGIGSSLAALSAAATTAGADIVANSEAISALEAADGVHDTRLTALETLHVDDDERIDAGAARTRLIAQAERTTPPTAYARCGTDTDANFQSAWTVTSPAHRLDILSWVRVVDARVTGFYEEIAESLDGLGDRDRYEKAKWNNDDKLTEYLEGTRAGDTIEYHREGDGHTQIDSSASSGPSLDGIWVRSLSTVNLDDHQLVNAVEDDMLWDFQLYGHNWRTVDTYTNPIIDSLAPTAGHNTWIGRGVGEYHIARVRMWADGVEVMDFDPSTGANDDITVTDSVAEILGSPVVWEGTSPNDKVVVPSTGGGAVDSVNGQTGTVVLDATDVGAATSSHNHDGTYQPLDSDLTSIAALTTTTFGRSLLTLANAAALLTTSGNGRRKFQNPAYLWDTASSGSEAFITDTATSQGGGWTIGEGLNDYIEFTDWLDAGTWTLEVWRTTTSASGIATFTLDGSTLGATEDGYSGSTVRNVRITRTGIVVASSGTHTLRIAMLSKNASSSGYRSGIQAYAWRRTA